jgi:putative transposase
MSEGTFCAWRARYSRMTVLEAKRLKALGDENAKLKKLLAGQVLDVAAMTELLSGMVTPA